MLVLLIANALAAPCPDVAVVVDEAWAAFDDAELQLAKEHLGRAVESLSCQERVVETDELIGMFRLDGLVSLAQEDRRGAVYASIRVVTIDPSAVPGEELGPDLAEMHATWAERLSETQVEVQVDGLGDAWVDGRPVLEDAPLTLVAGEHLVQARDATGWHSRVVEISEDTQLAIGTGLELLPVVRLPDPPPDLDPEPGGFNRRTPMLIGGGIGVAGGIGSVVWAFSREQSFHDDPYDAPSYGSCNLADPCYADEREKQIRGDASAIRALYATGYILTGVGVAVIGTELFILPDPVGGGGSVTLRVKW